MCSPEDFEYKRQRIEEEEERNMAPRRGRILEAIHHGGPHAGEGKENDQRTETSGEQEKMPAFEELYTPVTPPLSTYQANQTQAPRSLMQPCRLTSRRSQEPALSK